MLEKHCLHATIAASALAFALSAATASAQQPLPPLPTPQTPRPVPPILQGYKPVTAERLKQPEDGDWLMYRRTYDGWGYSPLSQITTKMLAGSNRCGPCRPVKSKATKHRRSSIAG